MKLDPWKTLEASLVFSAPPWVNVYREKVELPDGRTLDDFYRLVLPDFAVVVPMTEAGELVMVRGYRHGPGRVSLGAPSGYVEPGESPLQAAQRELLEETGYVASEWQRLGSFVVDGNRQVGTAHLFLARNVRQASTGANNPDPNEALQIELVSARHFFGTVSEGDVALLATVGAVALAMLTQCGFAATTNLTGATMKPLMRG
jgi:ADP-ribose pyrophosphatase